MKAMFFVRIIIILYLTGLGLIVFHTISEAAFSKESIKIRVKTFLKKIVFAPFYPLSLLSKQGRVSFLKKIKNI